MLIDVQFQENMVLLKK